MTDKTVERLLDMVDGLYRKYGVELDADDVAIAQAARNEALTRQAQVSDDAEVERVANAIEAAVAISRTLLARLYPATNSEAVSELVRADLERIVQMRPRNSNRVTTAHLMASRAEMALAKLGSRAP
jgi:hypothetical protein